MDCSLGRVVRSRAGRDKGRYSIVVGIVDGNHVLIADGALRKADSPKKKKLKHLFLRPEKAEAIAERLGAGKSVTDHDIREALTAMSYDQAD